ncbi:MAG: cyclophilin family peptidyl-prolyl cis-trans isomerase [Bacteroidia bacterium]|jgi:cyclophilin family peptidyl-prolyl cis-trans isomerase
MNFKQLALKTLGFLLILTIGFSACKDKTDNPTPGGGDDVAQKDTVIEITTDFGVMYMYMYKGTPIHRQNFHKLVSEKFYDGTEFHRIIPGFMIQGGDPFTKDDDRTNDGQGGPGYTIKAEIDSSLYKHVLGAVAAARIGNATNPQRASSGCQFYVVVSESGTKHLNGEYTVFGRVIKGIEVAENIVQQPRSASSNLPNDRIKMTMKLIPKTKAEIKTEFSFNAE